MKLELSEQSSQNIASTVNPVVPKRGGALNRHLHACTSSQNIPHTTNFEPFLGIYGPSCKGGTSL